jgi:hypothetical protein
MLGDRLVGGHGIVELADLATPLTHDRIGARGVADLEVCPDDRVGLG